MTLKIKLKSEDAKDDTTIKKLMKCTMPMEFDSGIYSTDLKDLLVKGIVEIEDFKGGTEVDIAFIDTDVPVSFPNSTIQIDEETTRQMTWREYVSDKRIKTKLDSTKAAMWLGYADNNGNRKEDLGMEELQCYIDEFGIDNIMTLSEFKTLIDSELYKNQETEQ